MLTVATPEEQLARDALTFEAWGAGLSREAFMAREQRLRGHAWAAKSLTTMLWRDARGEVLASCELFSDRASVGTKTGSAVTIASVFTEPKLRGKGGASAMLRALIDRLRTDANCLAATLYSEIGTVMYQRLGFWPVPAFDTFFEADARAPDGVEWIDGALPAPRHAPADAHTLRLELSSERLDWHLERERIYGEALSRPTLDVHGARVGESTITWTAYWKTNELQVLSFDAKTPDALGLLVRAAQHAANRVGLPSVRAWETMALASLPGARRVERTDEIAMFLPLTPGVQAWTQVERGLWA